MRHESHHAGYFPPILPLPKNEPQVWLAWTDCFDNPDVLEYCHDLLSAAEAVKCRKFYFPNDRHLYLVAHAMVRYVLAGYLRMDPKKLEFTANAYGRPEIIRQARMPNIRFNLSHTTGLAALVASYDLACGIDVETERQVRDISGLADIVLSAREREVLWELPKPDRIRAFLRFWTLKEAYVKARGKGLSIPLNRCAFDIGAGPDARFHAVSGDDPLAWQFTQSYPGAGYILAVAIRHGGGADLNIGYRELTPNTMPLGIRKLGF